MLVGHIDRIEPDCVAGWAADTDTPDSIEDVILYVDGRRVAQITCDLPREDLRQLEVYGEGCHGFRWRIAPPIPNHLLRSVTVRYARSGTIVAHQEITVHGPPGLNAILVTAA